MFSQFLGDWCLLTLGREPTMIYENPHLYSIDVPHSFPYYSYLNSLVIDFTPNKTKKKTSDGTESVCISVLCSMFVFVILTINQIVAFLGGIHEK